ncbi:MAG TPA: methyl-accepting chemotaxis protein [Candidatus Deferrimicrobiaceae bacterium]|jgi:methyl-accepting chemotaxis protein
MLERMSLGKKLTGGFLIVALICGIVGFVGYVNINKIMAADDRLYTKFTEPLEQIGSISTNFHRMRSNVYELLAAKDSAKQEKLVGMIRDRQKEIQQDIDPFEGSLMTDGGRESFRKFRTSYGTYLTVLDKFIDLVKAGKPGEAEALIVSDLGRLRQETQTQIEELVRLKVENAKKIADENHNTGTAAGRFMLGLVLGCIGLSLGLGLFLSRTISRSLNDSVNALSEGASQVTSAAGMLSSSSQALAEGSSEQAASLEETASAMEEMSAMTTRNSESAGEAKSLSDSAGVSVRKANDSMGKLVGQMAEISSTSEEIGKIIKTIDEIAFQTNLLALNAAVEAARAGEAGAGFAVVADEVRNLAQRAAGAAKNTSELIEGAIRRIKDGTDLVQKTNADFLEVTVTVTKVTDLVAEVSAASLEQSRGISEVSTAVSQMDKVTQQNAGSAEEIASAAEEMNSQSMSLQGIVESLRALSEGEGNGIARRPATAWSTRPAGKMAGRKSPTALSSGSGAVRGSTGRSIRNPEEVIPLDAAEMGQF